MVAPIQGRHRGLPVQAYVKYSPGHHRRRSLRLKGYDYAQPGAYFLTIVTRDRACLFGEVVEGEMRLNEAGQAIQSIWNEMPAFYAGVEIDEFVVMPNHLHGIVILVGATPRGRPDSGQAQGPAPTTLSLADVVHRFKTLTTKRYADRVKTSGWPPFRSRLWQRNYYEHVIRDEESLNRIRRYIRENPARWELDRENPAATSPEPEDAWRT